MQISADVRPKNLKSGTRTEAFYKAIGYKHHVAPDITEVVGTLTMTITEREELAFLAALNNFFATEEQGSIVISINGKEVAAMRREAGAPDLGCDSCSIMKEGHELDCPQAQV